MTEEMNKRIEDELESIWLGERDGVEYKFKNFDSGFQAGAKFILELPELREAVDCLEKARSLVHQDNVFGTGVEWTNFRYWSVEADQALSKIKSLGIVKEGET